MTSYNSYSITPGRWNPFNSDDLLAMKRADAQIEAEYARDPIKFIQGTVAQRHPVRKKRYDKPLTPEQKAKKNAKDRAYHAAHRHERNEATRAWEAAHREQSAARSREYYWTHRDEMLARHKAWRDKHKQA